MNSSNKLISDYDENNEDFIEYDESSVLESGPTSAPFLNYIVEVPKKSKRSPCFKIVVALVLFLLLFSLIFLFLYIHQINKSIFHQPYCVTASCVEASAFIKSSLDESVNPCFDFYAYSCGGWQKKNPIPDGETSWSISLELWSQNLQLLRGILDKPSLERNNFTSRSEFAAYILYQSCQNLEVINRLGTKPLLNILKIFGGFQQRTEHEEKFNKEKFNVMVNNFTKYAGIELFLSIFVTEDDQNSKKNIIKLYQQGLALASFRYNENSTDSVIQAYIWYLTNLAKKLDVELSVDAAYEIANETFYFEKDLSKIFVPAENLVTIEDRYYKTTLKELQKHVKNIDWLIYMNNVFNSTGIEFTEDEPIVVESMKFADKLDSLLEKTSMRVLQNYMMFYLARSYSNIITEDFPLLAKNLSIAEFGVFKLEPRWKRCIGTTDRGLGLALGSLFVKEAFAGSSYDEALKMVEAVRTAFIASFKSLSWMDEPTRLAAQEKADSINQKIGYPKFILDKDKLDFNYEGLELHPEEYFANEVKVMRHMKIKELKQLRKKVDKTTWAMTPPTINAYYDPSKNEIVFPAGILQAPYFKYDYPKYVNFGGMGSVIGHEITHGFDNNGRLYDAHGNYHNDSWWSKESVVKFKERSNCFVNEYSKFAEEKYNIKGNVTLGENLADNGGLKASFKAYKMWVEKNGEELMLPGLGKSNDEVFFIAFAQSWCTSKLSNVLIDQINTDVHSPEFDRVRGSVKFNKDFAKIFNCPIGSPMNPEVKCSVW